MKGFVYYILIGKRVFPTDMEGYVKWSNRNGGGVSKQIALTHVSPVVKVSTVFMCIDHNYMGEGKPVVFETMIFGGKEDQYQARYTTYGKALDGHEEAVKIARSKLVNEFKN